MELNEIIPQIDKRSLTEQIDLAEQDIQQREEEERKAEQARLEAEQAKALAAEKLVQPDPPQPVNPDAFMYQQEVNQQVNDPNTFGPGENLIEARNAIAKGAMDMGESVLTFPERMKDAANGIDIGADDYEVDWNPMKDVPSPYVRTWWGPVIENVSHYGTVGLAAVVGTAGATVGLGAAGLGMASAGVGALLSNKNDGDNLTGTIVKQVPELGFVLSPLATKDSDHPLLKKFKNVVEEMSIAGAFDRVIGKLFPEKAGELVSKRIKNVDDQVIEQGRRELDEAIEEVRVYDMTNQKLLAPEGGVPSTPAEPPRTPRPHMNKPMMDPWQAAPNSTGDPYTVYENLNEIGSNPRASGGSTDPTMTAAQAERAVYTSGLSEKHIQEQAKKLMGDARFARLMDEAKKDQRSFTEIFEPAYARMQEVVGRNATGMDVDEFWAPIQKDKRAFTGESKTSKGLDYLSAENVVATDLVIGSLFKQLRDLAVGSREIFDIADITAAGGPMKTITDRLIVGMTEVKRARFIMSKEFRALQGPKGARLAAEHMNAVREETKNTIEMAMVLIGKSKDDELLKGIVEAMSMSDKLHNWMDLEKYMRQRLHGFSKSNTALRELSAVYVNSLLSGVTTPLRAVTGTGIVAYMQPMGRAIGATMRGDIIGARSHFAAMHAMNQVLPEAFKVFKTQLNSHWAGDIVNSRYSKYQKTFSDQWAAQRTWVNQKGSKADKVAFFFADTARTLNNNQLFSWSPRVMASTDDTFKFIMARARAKEKAVYNALSMKKSGDLYEIKPTDIQSMEQNFYNQLLDADGTINLSKDSYLEQAFKEATLTDDLTGFTKAIDTAMGEYPITKPFYTFAKTGVNGLNLTWKSSPVLGLAHKRVYDVMRANPDNLEPLAKYGISTVRDLQTEKSLILGRQAISIAVTWMTVQKYMAGEITGNGPADPQKRDLMKKLGWQERSIRLGNTWVSYDLFEPFGTILAAVADIGDNEKLMGPEWVEERLQKQVFGIMTSATDKSYLAGLSDLVEMTTEGGKNWGKLFGNIANGAVPLSALRGDIGQTFTRYQRELDKEVGDSVRNRNLVMEQFASDPLPIKTDLLNGEPIKDWPFWQRATNAVLGINLSIDKMTPGRKLLMESNYTRSISISSYDGYNFRDDSRIRAKFAEAIGKVKPNLETRLDGLAKRKSVQDSVNDMKADIARGGDYRAQDPMKAYIHTRLISNEFNAAKKEAWAAIKNDPDVMALMAEQDKVPLLERTTKKEQVDEVLGIAK
tara:strand:- start:274 stop:4056 length:3783 start_codon:yes stop_codon:yes gene_type:complete